MNVQFFPHMLRSASYGTLLLSIAFISQISQPCRAQVPVSHHVRDTQDAIPEPAIPAILKAFDTSKL